MTVGAKKNLAIAAIALVLLATQTAAFIRVLDGRFVDEDCHEFTWVGANMWRMLELQASGLSSDDVMQTAGKHNITVLRVFATGVTPELPLQIAPGTYNKVALDALDGVMAAAADNGIRVTLVLARNWDGPDNKATYASWSGLASPDDFYTSPAAQADFHKHMDFMTSRINSVNGRVYREDPSIFSWDIMNEPRYFDNSTVCQSQTGKCTNAMQAWIESSSNYLRSVDPNHLIAIGSEGFWGTGSSKLTSNPSNGGMRPRAQHHPHHSDWAAQTGQNFFENTQAKNIDYAVIHVWPDNWNVPTSFLTTWVTQHMEDARTLGKPLVIEEFGKNVTDHSEAELESVRNPVFKTIFDLLQQSIAKDDVLKGAQYWMWDPQLLNSSSPDWQDLNADQVLPSESTMVDIIAPAGAAAAKNKPKVTGCTVTSAAPSTGTANTTTTAGRKLLSWL